MGLEVVEIVIALEEEYGIKIPDDEAGCADTIEKMALLVDRLIKDKGLPNRGDKPLDFIIEILVSDYGIPRGQIKLSSEFVKDLGLG
jgi:acyl carrier protein